MEDYLLEEDEAGEKSEESTAQEADLEETEIAEAKDEELFDEGEEEREEKPKPSARKEKEEEFVEERIYTIPLRRAWDVPRKKRAPKAMRIIKAFIKRHMKVGELTIDEEGEEEGGRIIIDNEVNEKIWNRGIEKPPRRLRIRAAKDEEGNVTVFLA
ncbi:50S ribosomal protein L31e [Candidatus Bathyarchaeota archaeon]|nr:50S ribosomal protein L31e [Candidatus Bathyarchaeota archaeon]